jgi:hypothetical protein
MPKLIEIAQEYAYLKGIEVKPVMIAIRQLIDICGLFMSLSFLIY